MSEKPDIEIKKLEPQDLDTFKALISLFEEVFEMSGFLMPADNYIQQLLDKQDFHVFVAHVQGQVLGGLTAYTLQQYYSTRPLTYIYDLAVSAAYQRKGIGRLLMAAIIEYCRERGTEEVFVQADRVDRHAVDFYHATGGTPEDVIHFNYPLNT